VHHEHRAQRLRSGKQHKSAAAHHHQHHHHKASHSVKHKNAETPTLPKMYSDADEIARYIEKRRPMNFATEGAKVDVDVPADQEETMKNAFEETPDIFSHCVLIRDFATPLRVGSALKVANLGRHKKSRTQKNTKKTKHVDDDDENEDDDDQDQDDDQDEATTAKAKAKAKESSADDEQDDDDDDEEDDEVSSTKAKNSSLPEDELLLKGGVIDYDETTEGSKAEALMEVNMMAYLQTVAGHVSVVPTGVVAKWTSKRKVPIAGYLCTDSGDPVLHTLPTPCVATALTDEGTDLLPPMPEPKANDSSVGFSAVGAPSPAMPGQKHASITSGEAPAGLSVNAPSPGPSSSSLSSSAAMVEQESQAKFSVYVGSAKLHFSSRAKANSFCHRLTRKIAEDPGDNEWDTDKVKDLALGTDMKLSTFVQLTRKDLPQAWTTGTKKVLVIVMDWMAGDSSLTPLTSQSLTPAYVRDTIFPRVQAAFKEMSYGKFQIEYTVVPEVIRYTKARSRYSADGFPFPGLYNGATESLAGNAKYGTQYQVANYDLVYTISPQQAPTGTKGVAWVGAKGAMCNGCEAISENFQVMVAVHELGHNLGLSHAGSTALEYGNPFDWMGNYPDVEGLSYGLGYKLKLHWLTRTTVAHVTDTSLSSLNDRYILMPFDTTSPSSNQIVGIQISLDANTRDLYISYRQTTGKAAGVYIVQQDKDSPNSELIDLACHSPSQKDARMQTGWTYVDPSGQVVVVLEQMSESSAILHLYSAPGDTDLAAIRARDTYTDGTYKCPRTCTDSDLLVSSFESCSALATQGYCSGGVITMSGTKFSVSTDLCPSACDQCESVLAGDTIVSSSSSTACADKNVQINSMSCAQIAAKGYCTATTNIGSVGEDLCPESCGNCPTAPTFSSNAGTYTDPTPERTHGDGSASSVATTVPVSTTSMTPMSESEAAQAEGQECVDNDEWKDSEGDGCSVYKSYIDEGKLTLEQACSYGSGDAKGFCPKTCKVCSSTDSSSSSSEGSSTCSDDASWSDVDGDNCAVYKQYIADGQLTRDAACSYNDGAAAEYCRETCNTCEQQTMTVGESHLEDQSASLEKEDGNVTKETCEDAPCVSSWLKTTGQCFTCSDWPSRCVDPGFLKDCPLTCGTCKKETQDDGSEDDDDDTEVASKDQATTCEDSECIDPWKKTTGKCLKCADYAADYCGFDNDFMEACPKSCKLCSAEAAAAPCEDHFKKLVCKNYKFMGWCRQSHIAKNCAKSCGKCDELVQEKYPYDKPVEGEADKNGGVGDQKGDSERSTSDRRSKSVGILAFLAASFFAGFSATAPC